MVEQNAVRRTKVEIGSPELLVEPKPEYIYHWDRIFAAFAVLILLTGLIGYGLYARLKPSRPPASVQGEEPPAEIAEPARRLTPFADSPSVRELDAETIEGAAVVQAPPGERLAELAPMPTPVREEIAEAAPAQTPVSESGEEERQSKGQEQTGEAVTAVDTSEGETGNGIFRSPKISISSPAVKRFVLAQSVTGNEPKGSLGDISMNADGVADVCSFSEVIGLAGEVLEYRWFHDGKQVLRIRVPVGAEHWRSHAQKAIYKRMTGAWRVELRDSAGQLLASADFVF